MKREASEVKAKLYQAESTVNDVVHHAERELAARIQAQSAADVMSGQLHHLKAEVSEFMRIHQSQSSNMSRLERDNAELRLRKYLSPRRTKMMARMKKKSEGGLEPPKRLRR